MSNLKICLECAHIHNVHYYGCKKVASRNLVTGRVSYQHCDAVRKDEILCGHDGKWFEPKSTIVNREKKSFLERIWG